MILDETQDGAWIRVRYLPLDDGDPLAGTEDLVSENEVEALLGVAELDAWSRQTAVTLLSVSGSE